MACQAIRSWTVSKLIGAFLDLAIAYVLLWCSTAAFFISEFLGFFGFSLPCSCNGVFSKLNPNHCLQKLLVDCPTNKISGVQLAVRSKFPFDSVWEKKLESEVIQVEGEPSCSSVSAATEEGKFAVKGKGVARARRQRGNLRRRCNISTVAPVVPLSSYGNSYTGKEFSDNSAVVDSHDVVEPSHVMELDYKSWFSSESIVVIADKDMLPLESQRNDPGLQSEHDGNLEDAFRILEQALKEERAARSALFFDLEKERTAAATAADEAMAMILRLQEEKAAIELEARQYERILEEKSTYDAEEMDVLKEIIVRREMEKHFLEKEVESYRKGKALQEKEQFEDETLLVPGENEELVIQQAFEDAPPLAQLYDMLGTAGKCDSSSVVFSQEFQEGCKPSMSHDHGYQEKSVVLIGEVKDDGETESNEQYDGKGPELLSSNLDLKEQFLYDIHVIDENKDNAESSSRICELSSEALEVQMADEPSSCAVTLPPLGISNNESKVSELRCHIISAVDHERQKLDNEVGCLRERLRSIQAGRSKLNFPVEHRDKGETELLLLDDISNLLQEVRKLTEPQKTTMRRTSLPPPGSKDTSKKRRCRSASVEPCQSS